MYPLSPFDPHPSGLRFWTLFVPDSRQDCNNNLCPQSSRAKFLRNFSKRSAKNAAKFWRNFSQIFVLQSPGKMAAKNFTKNPRHFPRCTKLSFFTAATLGASGPNNLFFLLPSKLLLSRCWGPPRRSLMWRWEVWLCVPRTLIAWTFRELQTPKFAQSHLSRSKWGRSNTPKLHRYRGVMPIHAGTNTQFCAPKSLRKKSLCSILVP